MRLVATRDETFAAPHRACNQEVDQLVSTIRIASTWVVPPTHKVLLAPGKSKKEEQTHLSWQSR
jgi:hypothetical protein